MGIGRQDQGTVSRTFRRTLSFEDETFFLEGSIVRPGFSEQANFRLTRRISVSVTGVFYLRKINEEESSGIA